MISSLLPTVIPVTSSKYQVTQYSAVEFIYRFEEWCLQVHIAENEDTLPTISQRVVDFMCLKTYLSCKITNYILYNSYKYIFLFNRSRQELFAMKQVNDFDYNLFRK